MKRINNIKNGYLLFFVLIVSSWLGSAIGNGLIYILYFNPWIESLIFGKRYQSGIFLTVWNNPELNKYIFAAGLVILSTIYGILYHFFRGVLKGNTALKGIKFGALIIFAGHYLQQEFYTPLMLLREPLILFLLELVLLFPACVVHGITLAIVYEYLSDRLKLN